MRNVLRIINYLSFALVYNLHIIRWLFTHHLFCYIVDNKFANVPFSDFMLSGWFFCGIKNDCQFHCYLTFLFNFQPNNTFAIIRSDDGFLKELLINKGSI